MSKAKPGSNGNKKTQLAVVERIDDGALPLVWNRETKAYIEERIHAEAFVQAKSMCQIGALLQFAKAHMDAAGEFIDWVEVTLGMSRTQAYQYMAAAVRFSGIKQITDGTVGKSKVLALMDCDDEEIKHLAEHGTLPDVPQDEFDRMSAAQLRRRIRAARNDQKKGTKQLSTAKTTIRKQNEQIVALQRGERPLPENLEQFKAETDRLDTIFYGLVDDLVTLAGSAGSKEEAAALRGTASEYEQQMASLWESHLFPVVAELLGEQVPTE